MDLNKNITKTIYTVYPKSTDLRQDPVYSKVKKKDYFFSKLIFYTPDFDILKNNIFKKRAQAMSNFDEVVYYRNRKEKHFPQIFDD